MHYYVGEKVREREDYTERRIFLPDIDVVKEKRRMINRALINLEIFKSHLDDWLMISDHFVVEEDRGQGHGKFSMQYALALIKRDYPDKDVFLVVYPDTNLVSFYEALGFHIAPGLLLDDKFPFMVYGYPIPRRMSQLEMFGRQAATVIINIPKSDRSLVKECLFVEEKNPLFYGRKHTCQIAQPSVSNDQMVIYAGLRSDTDKIPSLKLDDNTQKEIEDTKIEWF